MDINQLQKIYSRAPLARLQKHGLFLQQAMDEAKINTPLRIAAFLAQIGHESDELKYMAEIWGPTDAQKRYDPPSTLATKLGNVRVGDGYRYRGAGPLQLTGRYNYRVYGLDLGVDLESNPDLARTPAIGFRVACLYWTKNGLNVLADSGTQEAFDKITKRINGGFNGKTQRDTYWVKARKVLGC